ncbi:hypothetical protein JCGZ_15420 [Jatropha curcas]|uniref:Uncharacterized protein n=1 Tax=Jatropha curcas TaxID=180498 RepID=A0A067KGV4_JATCU|nr:hypothetical protein JCGZ_15420 [Jatropha curcas]
MIRQMEDMGCIGGIVLVETIRSLDRAALGFDNWTVSTIILQYRMRRILITHPSTDAWTSWLIELGPNEVLWYISWYDITRFIQLLLRVLPEPSLRPGLEIITWLGPYLILPVFTWFIAAVWPIERPRRNALLSALEGWAQVGTDDADGTDEEIVMAPRTGKVGEGLASKDDIEDVAPRRRRDT